MADPHNRSLRYSPLHIHTERPPFFPATNIRRLMMALLIMVSHIFHPLILRSCSLFSARCGNLFRYRRSERMVLPASLDSLHGMVGFRNNVDSAALTDWVSPQSSQIAFGRGDFHTILSSYLWSIPDIYSRVRWFCSHQQCSLRLEFKF